MILYCTNFADFVQYSEFIAQNFGLLPTVGIVLTNRRNCMNNAGSLKGFCHSDKKRKQRTSLRIASFVVLTTDN